MTPRVAALDSVVAEAIERRIFPGAVVLAEERGATRHLAAYGTTKYGDAGSLPVAPDTRYDVASLTKMFTATAALRQHEAGLLDLDAPADAYLDGLRAPGVLVRHLLTHTSGLDLRLSTLAREGRAALMDAVRAAPQLHPPGSAVAYTNINSLLLGEIVAALHGAPLDVAIGDLVIAPLGLRETMFRPPAALRERIAPTEHDAEWRGALVHGAVHDESAHALGGVAGHAGLFSTAGDMLRFCSAWLPGAGFLLDATIAAATANRTAELGRGCGLGWMIDRPNFMGAAPTGTYGHTGFTGPAIAVVPARRLVVVLLSNRVYPRRGAPDHHAVTARVIDTLL